MIANQGKATLITTYEQGKTVIREQYGSVPLKWIGPVDPCAVKPMIYLCNPNGGLLEGDQHWITVHLQAHTQLEIRTQAATRLHPGPSQQDIRLRLDPESTLIWIPHPMIPGSQSIYRQIVEVTLDPKSRLAYGEIWTAGRIGQGEQWQFQQLYSELQIKDPYSLPFLWETMDLHYPHTTLTTPSVLGSYPCWGSLYLLGNWGEVNWPVTSTQWSVRIQDPCGSGMILRQVGYQAHALWLSFCYTIQNLVHDSRNS